jgi:hypothetical protein
MLQDFYSNETIAYLLSPGLQSSFLPLKIIFLLIGFSFIGFMIFFLFKTRWFKLQFLYDFVEVFTLRIYGGVMAHFHWMRLRYKIGDPTRPDYNDFVIKCHKIMDKLLARLVPTYHDNNFGERLAQLGNETFSNVSELWEAHELYRSIINDPNFKVDYNQAKRTLEIYEKAFQDLEII